MYLCEQAHRELEKELYYSRLAGIVSSRFHERTILVAGVGAGSDMTMKLARMGPKRIKVLDRDRVDIRNLCRTSYYSKDLRKSKVEAIAAHIVAANPHVIAEPHVIDICKVKDDEVKSLCQDVDLLIAGTDSFKAQARINEWSLAHHIPAVFIGVHEHARGGVVVWSIPGRTSCYRCVMASRYVAAASEPTQVELPSARGSIVDIGFIDAVVLKIAVGILERKQKSEFGSFFRALGNRNQVVVRTHPDYRWQDTDLFDLVLDDLPREPKDYKADLKNQAFFAMDTLWLSTDRDRNCPDCCKISKRNNRKGVHRA